jgi:hypothetical protein
LIAGAGSWQAIHASAFGRLLSSTWELFFTDA